jgi:hypothetical protein
MRVATEMLASFRRQAASSWLWRELAPFPGRSAMTARLVVGAVIVAIVSMTLQTPLTWISAYMIFFATKENRVITTLTGIGLFLGATIGIAMSLFFYCFTFDYPEFRIPVMAASVFAGMFFSRVFAIGPLAFAIGFVLAVTQSMAESVRNTDELVRGLLWLWVVVVFPVAITVIINQTLSPTDPKPAAPAKPRKSLFVPDAFTNPDYVRFGLKVALSAMTCYILYCGLDWPGIRTAFVTCCFIALESTRATIHKARLRFIGCAIGGSMGFLAIMYLVPRMESIVSLAFLTAVGAALAGWVAAGSERISYAGLQIALAFFMCIFQGFAPDTNFETIRNRVVGILLGILVSSVVFYNLWPEREAETTEKAK